MSKSAFASTIIDKMNAAIGKNGGNFNAGSATIAMTAVAEGITEYLIDNVEVEIAYTGIIPGSPPSPDPLTTDKFRIIGSCAPTGPSDSFTSWMADIEEKIIAGFQLAPMGEKGVVFPMKPFAFIGIKTTIADLTSAHDVGDDNPQQKIWEIICGGIMDWINTSAMNPVPGAATHPTASSSGTGQIVKITIT